MVYSLEEEEKEEGLDGLLVGPPPPELEDEMSAGGSSAWSYPAELPGAAIFAAALQHCLRPTLVHCAVLCWVGQHILFAMVRFGLGSLCRGGR